MTLPEQIREAEAELSLAKATENRRRAAEASYVVHINALEDAAPRYFSLAGIHLPNLIHEDVVRSTFPEYCP